MSVLHPTSAKLEALRSRWEGQEARLAKIADAMLAGQDWTVFLSGLPHVGEIPPLPGEALGRDLRGADLRRFLRPSVSVREATEGDAGLIAAITWEAMQSNTPFPGASPFPAELQSAEEMAVAIRRGETFLLAHAGGRPVGVVRIARRREFAEFVWDQRYSEVSGLAVLPAHRRGGIGAQLLIAAEAHAKADGHPIVVLRTTHEVGLVPYYHARGYEVRHVRQLSYPGSPTFLDVVMAKNVARSGLVPNGKPRIRHAR